MTFRTNPVLGPDVEQHATAFYFDSLTTNTNTGAQLASYQLGARVSGTDGCDYIYVKAGGSNIAATTQLAITSDGTFVATSGGTSGFYTVGAVLANEFFHCRAGNVVPTP